MQRHGRFISIVIAAGIAVALAPAAALAAPDNVRLTNDTNGGYVSDYTMVTGQPYTDTTLSECGRSHGRQNEPSVAIDPRNTNVLVGSSNDYCGVYNDGVDPNGAPIASGPIWLGYYRSRRRCQLPELAGPRLSGRHQSRTPLARTSEPPARATR